MLSHFKNLRVSLVRFLVLSDFENLSGVRLLKLDGGVFFPLCGIVFL